ncbi:MAG: ATP-binding protein, partial [Pseudomonadota bacterium]
LLEKSNLQTKGLRYQFLIISSLMLVLPILILSYLFYETGAVFSITHLVVLTGILLLILAGLMALRYIFDKIFDVAASLKEAGESGATISVDLKKDVTELDEILTSFNGVLQKFERATEQVTQKTLELNAVKDIGQIALRSPDVNELLLAFLDRALAMTKSQIGSLFMVDPALGCLRLIGARGMDHLKVGTCVNIDDSLARYVVSEKRPLLVQDVESDPRIQKKNEQKYGAPSFLTLPISTGKHDVTAVLNLSNKRTGEVFDANDESMLSIMQVEIGFSLENVLLHAQLEEHIKNIEERNINLEREVAIRRETEDSLRESEARFRELADLLPQTVFEADLAGRLLFANRTAFESFGYTQEDLEGGLNILHLFTPDSREKLSVNTQKILSGETLSGVEYRALRKDGGDFPIAVYACPILQDHQPSGLRGIAIDITERKLAEEAQERLHEELVQSEKLAAIGACAAGVAHEVKNPLAVIVQGVEYLKMSLESDMALLDVTERIKRSALRADLIVKGLLSFTRQVPIQTEEMKITPLIEETLSYIEQQIQSRHVRVIRQYAPDLPNTEVDGNQIKQVFINILLNSVDAMQDGGMITISVDFVRDASDLPFLQIIFSDTGCGIPEGKMDKVFDPFFTTKTSPGNVGLGLSITKGIIDKHHGSIRVESESGKGTRMIIKLPAIRSR